MKIGRLIFSGFFASMIMAAGAYADTTTSPIIASKGYVDNAFRAVRGDTAQTIADVVASVNTLNADASTEGSVASKIASVLNAEGIKAVSGSGAINVSDVGVISVATAGEGVAGVVGVAKADGTTIRATSGVLSIGSVDTSNISVPESCTADSHLCVLTWKTDKVGGAGWVLVDITDTPAEEA